MDWIFFDLGSTLIDESACADFRTEALLRQPGAPDRETLLRRMAELAAENRLPYKDAAKEFGLETMKWPGHLEKLYAGVPELLGKLQKKYCLGIIANQNAGTEARMEAFGIRKYFDLVISSAEEGIAKPDPRIFLLALERAGCRPETAWMAGDRLDNDILPAAKLGMKTIWIRQGSFAGGDPEKLGIRPDLTVDTIKEAVGYLLAL
ncbi:MAG: HAD family hydrolase [Oscillospiraceae bacterium]|nr:HAD family hydrolase [Oscillospiraceae bacterium]